MKLSVRLMLLLALMSFSMPSAVGMNTVDVNTALVQRSLFDVIEYVEDPAQSMTLDQVRSLPASRFSTVTRNDYSKRFTTSAFWVRFAVRNTDRGTVDWAVQHRMPVTDFVEFWILVDGKVVNHAIGGDRTLASQRQVPYRFPTIRHVGAPGETAEVYIWLHNRQAVIAHVQLSFMLVSAIELVRQIAVDQIALGIMYGMVLAVAFGGFAGWLVLRDRRFVFFALWALSVLASWAAANAHLGQYVVMPGLVDNVLENETLYLITVTLAATFCREFLQTRQIVPGIDRLLQAIIWACCAGILLLLAGVDTGMQQLAQFLIVSYNFTSPLAAWFAFKRGVLYARWYLLASLLYAITISINIVMWWLGDFPYDAFVYAESAVLSEILLFSIALYDRTRILQQGKDKTEQESKEALTRSEARLRMIADHLPVLIAYVDREERYRFCNRHYETMMHLTPADLVGRRVSDVMGKEHYAAIASQLPQVWKGEPVQFERSVERAGGMQNIEYRYIPDVGKDGSVLGFYSIISDITERREAQRKQIISEKLLRAVTDHLPALVCYIDQEHRFRFTNRAYETWFKRPISEITGRKVREVYGEDAYQEYRQYFDLALCGQSVEFEFELKRKDGPHFYKASYVPQFDDEGMLNGICGLVSDVTALKNITEEYRRQKLEADLANASKSRFLAAASHDLRQPLHALGLLIANLKATADEAGRRSILEQIERVLEGMDSEFHALLDVSKLDAGVIKPELIDFPINDLLDAIETEYAALVAEKGLKLIVHRSCLVVHSDPVLIGQIVRNLVSNAIKYSHSGHVAVGCRRVDGKACRVVVRDTGPGIPESERENVFQEFYQLDNPHHDRAKGMGLGLAIVRRTARLLGCELKLQSVMGRGTMFSLWMPVSERVPAQRITAQVAEMSTGRLVGRLVVVLDDDAYIASNTTVLLEGWGCEVLASGTYRELEDALNRTGRRPDLLLFDYTTGDRETGVELALKLQQQYADHPPPVLILTGDTSPEKLTDLRASGFHLLTKPVRPARLRVVIGRIFEESEEVDEAAQDSAL